MTRKKISDQALLDALLRRDFNFFLHRCFRTLNPGKAFLRNWHHQAIAYELERIRRGENNRLIINVQPRSLKSLMASVVFPAFVLGHEPEKRIIAISYGEDLAIKHANDFRAIVQSRFYQRAFPKMRATRSLVDLVETTKHGYRMATTVGGSLTGLGGDIIIVDDPQKAIEAQSETNRKKLKEWFSNTLLSRLDDKRTGAIIVVMQRVHADDLCEHLMNTSGDWTILSLPAIAEADETIQIGKREFYHRKLGEALHPEREPVELLKALQQEIGSYDFAAQYQQNPVPSDGGMIKPEWIRYYDPALLPKLQSGGIMIHSWDTAAKPGEQNSWSACTIWLIKEDDYYLVHLERGRYTYPDLLRKAKELSERYKPSEVLVEDASTGIVLAQELPKILRVPVKAMPVERDKISRLYLQQAKFEAGHVHFPREASFLPELLAELFAFPRGKHDDQVDSITQALSYEVPRYGQSMDGICRFYENLAFEFALRNMAAAKGRP
jgi:predicted phage terminase large subunit-like protein